MAGEAGKLQGKEVGGTGQGGRGMNFPAGGMNSTLG